MNIESMKDKELVAEFNKGKEEAFVELVTRYTEKVYNLGMRITRNEQDAEEVVQDVFITLHEKLHTFQGKSAFSSWLYRVTANAAFMMLRSRRKHAASNIDDIAPGAQESNSYLTRSETSDLDFMTSRHEMRDALQEAIESLPSEYKTIFILRDVDGLSNQEVGEILDLSVPAVKSRLHRSRLMLRKSLQKFYDDYRNSDKISYGLNPQAGGFAEYAMAA